MTLNCRVQADQRAKNPKEVRPELRAVMAGPNGKEARATQLFSFPSSPTVDAPTFQSTPFDQFRLLVLH